MSEQPLAIYLKDYLVPSYLIKKTALRFELAEDKTIVTSQLVMLRNPECQQSSPVLELHGHDSLVLLGLELDGTTLMNYERNDEKLIITDLPEKFELQIQTEIEPQNNTALEGLYKSDGMFCTQCEAEGFRRITFYQDRPDVMSEFTTTIVADGGKYPVLLSNGNLIEQGKTDDGRDVAVWHDPFPKPAYLFALVAGDLEHIEDSYTTMSGREVTLKIFAEAKDLDKLQYSMRSLQSAMQWDEKVYGREYDLDIYMIVAVDFFNMGAMENKGLNIFNTSCVLAHPETTTDAGFQRVEAVVAHEYFHNWSGNRVTCRDWFQLSLKEGFTVFRDAEFSADMNSRTVKRIEDVSLMRTAQFAEDAGPLAHPIRPASFIEISNFYTLTVYEKGAEVVRMIHRILGEESFRKGSDLYFERHDGQAVTTDDFVQAMEDASGKDLSVFRNWYSQAGTPRLTVTDEYDEQNKVYSLHLKQSCPPTPECQDKKAFHIPLAIGLLDQQGNEFTLENGSTTQVLDLVESEQTFSFENIDQQPTPSLLRGFSAPVKLAYPYTVDQLLHLIEFDSDGFNRWDAMQTLLTDAMEALVANFDSQQAIEFNARLVDVFGKLLSSDHLDQAMLAKMLTLPSQAYLTERAEEVDVDAIHHVHQQFKVNLANVYQLRFVELYQQLNVASSYAPDAESIARRSLKNLCLSYLMSVEGGESYLDLAEQQYRSADNMTDMMAALVAVVHSDCVKASEELLEDFYERWKDESLVVNQWFSVQASNPGAGALANVRELMQHTAFDIKNPNRVRALLGAFCGQNAVNFHNLDGSGYDFLADQVIALNLLNPQIASRLLMPLTRWRKYSEQRQAKMKQALQRVKDSPELSKDVFEVVSKSLA